MECHWQHFDQEICDAHDCIYQDRNHHRDGLYHTGY
ncbi:MAG: hypothetical protein CVU42_13890 [Chloroflexi bacterium HGW-Chloroflexi-4]|nr:MAG: hypothetical protein CVU42_13890 [Chloroflexi bacterium HGW-Chloroflexi-4]